ncbi:formylglycine-generating enzyme family protein [Bradyrhizobium sp.]|uniref:formylglycine-generating enzyme family protein n=1 Tax=Bradyrhizobium sp. TaxID=376 RepID=UPI003C19B7A0
MRRRISTRLGPATSWPPVAGGLAWLVGIVASSAAAASATIAVALAIQRYGEGPGAPEVLALDLTELPAGVFEYRRSGDFSRDGGPVTAPTVTAVIVGRLVVMRHQVTAAAYRRCVEAGACQMSDRGAAAVDRPAVGLSWRDASAYAAWLSDRSGVEFRLPTDEEWAYAAASRFSGDDVPDSAIATDPGRRALARYDRDSRRDETVEREPQPIGSFGTNENGLADLAGNVWEWTDTCFARNRVDQSGAAVVTGVNCGVRVVEGRHRAYVTDFIRDPRSGGCTVGSPPSNLGFRLVRDDRSWQGPHSWLGQAHRLMHLLQKTLRRLTA